MDEIQYFFLTSYSTYIKSYSKINSVKITYQEYQKHIFGLNSPLIQNLFTGYSVMQE